MGKITRREALSRIGMLLGGAVAAPISAGVLSGCSAKSGDAAFTPRALTPDQDRLVVALTERILPETDTPGASAARVNTFIDAMLADWYPDEDRDEILAGLQAVDAQARDTHGRPFAECSVEEQDAVVLIFDRAAYPDAYQDADGGLEARGSSSHGAFFRNFKQLTLVGYYTSEVGATQELHVNPMGVYKGSVPYAEVGRSWA